MAIRRTPEAIAREWVNHLPNAARWIALHVQAGLLADCKVNRTVRQWIEANATTVLAMTAHVADQVAAPTAVAVNESPCVTPTIARQMVLDAFARLDIHGHNQVSIVALVDETGLPLAVLHAAIQALRWEGILTLAALEGRHGITARERETAIVEHDQALGYVSRCV